MTVNLIILLIPLVSLLLALILLIILFPKLNAQRKKHAETIKHNQTEQTRLRQDVTAIKETQENILKELSQLRQKHHTN
ncbi:hypothetical protein [Shouchella lehensis]|uniref:Uncharacterized protein n=1 Tax=Shouchella lehensis TaxID=300825 RepID=A0A4Y7WLL3_9BACI|nr:hypothetical protein [Shouchella lehensis]MBG9783065.1 hypothetical protein [Shouchella lehensis]TES49576.1 hypothetical protein E2L03_08915 [Shouchella lehensis]